jgi:hypothetical protein
LQSRREAHSSFYPATGSALKRKAKQVATAGDTFLPITGWSTIAMAEGAVGIELIWAESEDNLRASRLKTARVFLAAEKAVELADSLRSQAAISLQRQRPN